MFNRTMILLVISTLAAGGFIACDSNPVHNNHTEHAEAVAMLVLTETDTLLYQHESNGIIESNPLDLTVGEKSEFIDVKFEAADGDIFQPEAEAFSLQATTEDTTVASVINSVGNWNFQLRGNSPGSTSLTVKLMHENHPDFTGQSITVMVTE